MKINIRNIAIFTIIFSIVSANEITLNEYVKKVIHTSYEWVELGLQTDELENKFVLRICFICLEQISLHKP